MGYYGYKAYVPVAKRRAKALSAVNKAVTKGANYSPIEPYSGAVAKTFWGKAWCNNLEQYSDYANRLPRGRTYVRNGSVIDLKVSVGNIQALVMGSQMYHVSIKIQPLPQTRWKAVCADCASSVASLIELLQGKLSKAVMERICTPKTGLFPDPNELTFECSCPDWAGMCKHVAAVLYGVGARLDQQPDLLFTLRHVQAQDLVAQASATTASVSKTKSQKLMDDSDLADVFGLEMAQSTPVTAQTTRAKKPTSKAAAPAPTPQAKTTASKRLPAKAAKKATGR